MSDALAEDSVIDRENFIWRNLYRDLLGSSLIVFNLILLGLESLKSLLLLLFDPSINILLGAGSGSLNGNLEIDDSCRLETSSSKLNSLTSGLGEVFEDPTLLKTVSLLKSLDN